MSSPTERSWTMLKRLCLYLTSVRNNSLRLHVCEDGLWHSPTVDDGVVIDLFSDSDWAAHKGHRRSVSSGAIFFQGPSFACSQPHTAQKLKFMQRYLQRVTRCCFVFALISALGKRLKLILDNTAAKQVRQRSGVGRLRHLSCRVLWIQGLVKRRELETASICTKENFADLGTKKIC